MRAGARSATAAASTGAVAQLYATARSQPQLALSDNDFSGLQTGRNDELLFHARPCFHGAKLGFAVVDDIDVGAFLTGLDGLVRNHDSVLLRSQPECDVDKLSGPEFTVGI